VNRFGSNKVFQPISISIALIGCWLLAATPAVAHHAMDGKVPANFFQGFLSGIAHPLIGIDHFAFIVSVGLLAAIERRGFLIPVAFVLAAMLGTGAHLANVSVPGVELFVSGSILLFGVLLAIKNRPNSTAIASLSGLAGLFHGYAYGESIFGAETSPLLAYLLGFTVIQLLGSLAVFWAAKATIGQASAKFRSAGLVICGVGLAFLASQIVAVMFPAANG
jgi:urease accessory protein